MLNLSGSQARARGRQGGKCQRPLPARKFRASPFVWAVLREHGFIRRCGQLSPRDGLEMVATWLGGGFFGEGGRGEEEQRRGRKGLK